MADERVLAKIERIHRNSRAVYGSPRVYKALKKQGERIGKKRVERLMRHHHLKGRSATLYWSNPGTHAFFSSVPNREREVLADRPDKVWVGDVTYLKVGQAWRYLATVMDKCTRRIVGWSISRHRTVDLTLKALNRAAFHRRPKPGVIFHSDRGIEYSGFKYRDRLTELGMIQSMNRPGKMTDNAHMESFFHSMKSDVIHGVTFETEGHLMSVIRSYMPFYNQERIHTSLGDLSPAEYERNVA